MMKLLIKKYGIVAVILLPYSISIILKLTPPPPKGHIKGRLISRILILLKNQSSGLKIIGQFDKEDQNVHKTTNQRASIHSNQTLLSNNRLELST